MRSPRVLIKTALPMQDLINTCFQLLLKFDQLLLQLPSNLLRAVCEHNQLRVRTFAPHVPSFLRQHPDPAAVLLTSHRVISGEIIHGISFSHKQIPSCNTFIQNIHLLFSHLPQ